MLRVTHFGTRLTLRCGCGCFVLTLRNPTAVSHGTVRCPICAAQASLDELMRAWHDAIDARRAA